MVAALLEREEMIETVRFLVCQQCAKEKTNWAEDCPHAMAVWKNGYNCALNERPRPRLTSEDVRRALSGLSITWKNFYHLGADALNRILDEKEKKT
jgi:hypothetical protein